ncbi:hypothetical protein Y032_0272g963 [Ancylostoma ceylanicum]|uniref:Uncharacterized protein n=1 Tax=Ancylostoma ceylanicum TaxID=53326 RepID=A0A016S8B6_9BILA|nr:hypothetical protein Y032_0272g963 [Ancylostoma ceylanicum]
MGLNEPTVAFAFAWRRDHILCGALTQYKSHWQRYNVIIFDGDFYTAFGCENTLITDKWREMILTFNNEKREIVAMGKQADKSGKYLPEAKEMYKLVRFR